MKKVFLFIALIASLGGGLQAQDTLWMKPAPLSNYYNNNWIDTSYGRYVGGPTYEYATFATARQFITKDTLQVYGIAAMMATEFFEVSRMFTPAQIQAYMDAAYPEDPSFENCEESLMLFQYHGNGSPVMQQLGDSLPVHYLHTTPTHYLMSNRPYVSFLDTFPKPVYERYFSTPQTVYDTFFVGNTLGHMKFNYIDSIWYKKRPIFGCFSFDHNCEGALWLDYDEEIAIQQLTFPDEPIRWGFFRDYVGFAYYIFPILTPDPSIDTTVVDTTIVDTTIVDTTHVNPGDTVAINTLRLLERYVSVQPNPATERVQVLSSFGVGRVEVYNAAGLKVMDLKAQGFKATFDVSRLPSGTYLLRIHTQQGVVTKKLAVR